MYLKHEMVGHRCPLYLLDSKSPRQFFYKIIRVTRRTTKPKLQLRNPPTLPQIGNTRVTEENKIEAKLNKNSKCKKANGARSTIILLLVVTIRALIPLQKLQCCKLGMSDNKADSLIRSAKNVWAEYSYEEIDLPC